jgi:hypothetical protein
VRAARSALTAARENASAKTLEIALVKEMPQQVADPKKGAAAEPSSPRLIGKFKGI